MTIVKPRRDLSDQAHRGTTMLARSIRSNNDALPVLLWLPNQEEARCRCKISPVTVRNLSHFEDVFLSGEDKASSKIFDVVIGQTTSAKIASLSRVHVSCGERENVGYTVRCLPHIYWEHAEV